MPFFVVLHPQPQSQAWIFKIRTYLFRNCYCVLKFKKRKRNFKQARYLPATKIYICMHVSVFPNCQQTCFKFSGPLEQATFCQCYGHTFQPSLGVSNRYKTYLHGPPWVHIVGCLPTWTLLFSLQCKEGVPCRFKWLHFSVTFSISSVQKIISLTAATKNEPSKDLIWVAIVATERFFLLL